jgi:hypothetical protein
MFEQMAKMRMNWMGLHTYPIKPRDQPGTPIPYPDKPARPVGDICGMLSAPEPNVWIGLEGDFDPTTGGVNRSYPSTFFTTWGFVGTRTPTHNPGGGSSWAVGHNAGVPMNTSAYLHGAGMAFSADDYGSACQMAVSAGAKHNPGGLPETPSQNNALFNCVARMYNRTFHYGRSTLGMKIAIGTEIPLAKPPLDPSKPNASRPATERYYEAMFRRIEASHPLDYYWFWTPEGWEWSRTTLNSSLVSLALADLQAATAAYRVVQPSFKLATCGWVLGPVGDRGLLDTQLGPEFVALASIEQDLGQLGPDPSYKAINREKWVIPWMEDDGHLAEPQFWVARTLAQ